MHRFNTDSPKMASYASLTSSYPTWYSTLRLEYFSRTAAIGLSPILFISDEGSSPHLRLVVAITHDIDVSNCESPAGVEMDADS